MRKLQSIIGCSLVDFYLVLFYFCANNSYKKKSIFVQFFIVFFECSIGKFFKYVVITWINPPPPCTCINRVYSCPLGNSQDKAVLINICKHQLCYH